MHRHLAPVFRRHLLLSLAVLSVLLISQACSYGQRPVRGDDGDDREATDQSQSDDDASDDANSGDEPVDDTTSGDDDDSNSGGGSSGDDDDGNNGGGNNGGNDGGSNNNGGGGSGSTPSGGPVPAFVDDCGGLNDDFSSRSGIESIDQQIHSSVQLCSGEEDWYQINIPAGTWVSVEIDISGSGAGGTDLDLVEVNPAGDAQWWSASEQSYERLAWYNPGQAAQERYLMVYGYQGAAADYEIIVRVSNYHQGMDCDSFFPLVSSSSQTSECNRIMQVPQSNDVSEGYFVEHQAHYSNLRREVAYLITWATEETASQFPGTNPLSLMDLSERGGETPGAMVGQLRHPEGTHINGNDADIAYYQTGADNEGRAVCANDGYFCTSTPNILDATRTAFFMIRLMDSPHLRVIGVDTMIATELMSAANALRSQGVVTQSEVTRLDNYMAWGEGWPFHHHHMHFSWDWEDGYEGRSADAPEGCIIDEALDPYAPVAQPL